MPSADKTEQTASHPFFVQCHEFATGLEAAISRSACFGTSHAGITVLKVRIPPETSDFVAKAYRVFFSVSATTFRHSAGFQIVCNTLFTDRSTVDTT